MLHVCYITVIFYEWEIITNVFITCNIHVILHVTFRYIIGILLLYICVCWVIMYNIYTPYAVFDIL